MNHRSKRQVWTYYSLVDPIKKICMCRVCGKHLKFKSTGNLKKHLIRLHSIKDVGRINETLPIIVRKKEFIRVTEDKNEHIEQEDSENNKSASEIEEIPCSDNEDVELDASVSSTQPSSNAVSLKETPSSCTANEKIELDVALSSVSSRFPLSKTPSAKVPNSHKNEEHEFDLFCKSLAIQLKKLPLDRALICQEKLLGIMIEERLKQFKASSDTSSEMVIPVLYNLSHTSNTSTDNIINSTVLVPAIYDDNVNSNSSDP